MCLNLDMFINSPLFNLQSHFRTLKINLGW